jgi:hypothetical protein
MNKEQLLLVLNEKLKSHPKYQEWMKLEDVEIKGNRVIVPRGRSPESANVEFSRIEAIEIYQQVCSEIIQ